MLSELGLEALTTGFQQFDIGDAVVFHFLPQIESVVVGHLFCVPPFQVRFLFDTRAFGIVHVRRRHRTLVLLIFQSVEKMQEETFA